MNLKYTTILISILIALFACGTAYADEPDDAWDAECAGRPIQSAQNTVSASDFQYQGIVEYNGRTETWYSSNALYHYRTDEWTPDDDGFYRTDEGYYVVASDAYEQGAIIETSRGLAQVLDCGCGEGVDFYTNWL